MSGKPAAGFAERVERALKDEQMQRAVPYAQDRLRNGRMKAREELENWEEWREWARRVRKHTLDNLDVYLEQLADNVRKAGGQVHFAATAEEAVSAIAGIAREKGARLVVKSKSMVTEEIHLNAALEQMGVEVVESDLGEYIIQLAGETPSHIIGPAIHKTKEQVARLFSQVAGRELPVEIEALTAFAREQLRQKFLDADIGISGVNFAVAETGSIVIVSNEGNGRLATTLPKTHIAVMGMERVVPTWDDLDPLLTLLPRSATGQKSTVYVTAITGPRRAGDLDGPEEFHLVIVDNGRSNILGTKYQEVLQCIRCSACLNVCPVYRHIGGHAYGSIYSGPIGAVLTPLLQGYEHWSELPYASSLCGACSEVCPVKIPLDELLIEHRRDLAEQGKTPASERLAMKAFGFIAGHPGLYEQAGRWGSRLARIIAEEGYIEKAPGMLGNWTANRALKQPEGQSFRQWWKEREKGRAERAEQDADAATGGGRVDA